MNEHEKMIINQLRIRMETNPDVPMLFRGTPYTPVEMINEIETGTSVGNEVVKDLTEAMWEDMMRRLRISGWTGIKKK